MHLEVSGTNGPAQRSVMDEIACHLHPILCTWDAVTTCTPVTVFLPTWGAVMLKKQQQQQQKKKTPSLERRKKIYFAAPEDAQWRGTLIRSLQYNKQSKNGGREDVERG